MGVTSSPKVSIIVPARNEEVCLASCLESLVAQTGIDYEIIVVDDDSTDRTAEIARGFASTNRVGAAFKARPLVVIPAPALPDGWTGKNNAMAAGAKVAKGKWLLFTDADTVHKRGSLARAVAEAEEHGAALLSYSPGQEVRTFWEKAVMPVIFAELAATYPPSKVNDPASPIAAANGQYLMISRETYNAVGGHTTIAGDLLEDVAMARLVKASGRRVYFRYGGDAVRTRMYRSWSQMKEGWTKNLALLFKHPLRMAARYAFQSFVLLSAFIGVIHAFLFGPPQVPRQSVLLPHYPIPDQYFPLFKWWGIGFICLLIAYLLVRSIGRVSRARFPLSFSIISMLGPPMFAYLLLRSVARRIGGVNWKGRTYGNTRRKTHCKSTGSSSAGAAFK